MSMTKAQKEKLMEQRKTLMVRKRIEGNKFPKSAQKRLDNINQQLRARRPNIRTTVGKITSTPSEKKRDVDNLELIPKAFRGKQGTPLEKINRRKPKKRKPPSDFERTYERKGSGVPPIQRRAEDIVIKAKPTAKPNEVVPRPKVKPKPPAAKPNEVVPRPKVKPKPPVKEKDTSVKAKDTSKRNGDKPKAKTKKKDSISILEFMTQKDQTPRKSKKGEVTFLGYDVDVDASEKGMANPEYYSKYGGQIKGTVKRRMGGKVRGFGKALRGY